MRQTNFDFATPTLQKAREVLKRLESNIDAHAALLAQIKKTLTTYGGAK